MPLDPLQPLGPGGPGGPGGPVLPLEWQEDLECLQLLDLEWLLDLHLLPTGILYAHWRLRFSRFPASAVTSSAGSCVRSLMATVSSISIEAATPSAKVMVVLYI